MLTHRALRWHAPCRSTRDPVNGPRTVPCTVPRPSPLRGPLRSAGLTHRAMHAPMESLPRAARPKRHVHGSTAAGLGRHLTSGSGRTVTRRPTPGNPAHAPCGTRTGHRAPGAPGGYRTSSGSAQDTSALHLTHGCVHCREPKPNGTTAARRTSTATQEAHHGTRLHLLPRRLVRPPRTSS